MVECPLVFVVCIKQRNPLKGNHADDCYYSGKTRAHALVCTEWLTFAKITGVLIMSFIGCGLLEEALDDMGAAGYFFGTFIVHYLPGKHYLTLD